MKKLVVLFFTTMFVILSSCDKVIDHEIEEITSIKNTELSKTYPIGNIILGRKLENPFELANMQKALDNLMLENPNYKLGVKDSKIKVTHLYIKFIPDNEKELQKLKVDSTIILYDHPLDYEIKQRGNSYHDPEVSNGKPTYQYTSVELNKVLPKGVKFNILAKLHIPSDDDFETVSNGKTSSSVMKIMLEKEAFRLTNNEETNGFNQKGAKVVSYTPKGRIMIYDDTFSQNIGLEGIEVRARRWFTTHVGYTDTNGFYTCNGTFSNDCNYSIDWERYNFEIREGSLGGASYNGPNKSGDWNLLLDSGPQRYFGQIFRAAYRYYYKSINGLRKPPENSFWSSQLSISAHYQSNSNFNGVHCSTCGFLGIGSSILIYNPTNESREIFAATIHELAHASHWNMDSNNFNNGSVKNAESWAKGVQWSLTNLEYSALTYNTIYYRILSGDPYPYYNYTGIVEDMIDGSSGYDGVSGYSIRQLEDGLVGQNTWGGWKNNIKNIHNNATENNLDFLFSYWGGN